MNKKTLIGIRRFFSNQYVIGLIVLIGGTLFLQYKFDIFNYIGIVLCYTIPLWIPFSFVSILILILRILWYKRDLSEESKPDFLNYTHDSFTDNGVIYRWLYKTDKDGRYYSEILGSYCPNCKLKLDGQGRCIDCQREFKIYTDDYINDKIEQRLVTGGFRKKIGNSLFNK